MMGLDDDAGYPFPLPAPSLPLPYPLPRLPSLAYPPSLPSSPHTLLNTQHTLSLSLQELGPVTLVGVCIG
jgi:hypothetical protein